MIAFIFIYIACSELEVRKSDLEIKKSKEPNGYLKIIFKGDTGYNTPFLKINLSEDFPKVKRRIPLIYLEDMDTSYALEARVEKKEIIIPIKQGEYFASIANEELYTSLAFFSFPLFFLEDKYIGMSFGFDENYDVSNKNNFGFVSGKCINQTKSRSYFFWPVLYGDINFNYCPKLKIVANKITEVEVTFSDEKIKFWRSLLGVIPGSIAGIPLFGTIVYKSDSTVKIKYPE